MGHHARGIWYVIDAVALATLVAPDSVAKSADAIEAAARTLRVQLDVVNDVSGGQDPQVAVHGVDDAKRDLINAGDDFQRRAWSADGR